jgi:4a-hydroxytetrahydrobiopterin dehydratase
MLRKD